MATYMVESREDETGLVARWHGVTEKVMDWIRSEHPSQSQIIEVLGPPAHVFFSDPWPEPSGD